MFFLYFLSFCVRIINIIQTNILHVLLLSTSSLQWYGLHRIFDFAKKSWFDGIDLSLTRSNYDLWDEDYIKYLSDSFDVPVLSITAPSRWMNEKRVDQIISIANKLKSQVVTFSPPYHTDKNLNWYSRYLSKVKRDTHLSVAIKNVESDFIYFVIPKYKNSTLYEIKKVTWDTALDLSSVSSESWMDILKAQKMLWSSMKNIFLSDKRWAHTWILPGTAGGGISYLPLESFFMKLKTTGYNGFITLKVKPNELGAGNEERVVQNLDFVKSYYTKHFKNFR